MDAYDISRDIFNPKKHYTGVRMQQGRVLTDDDWNENGRIDNEDKRRSRVDIIGPYGSPDDGYKVGAITIIGASFDFPIAKGILYLGGLRLYHGDETYQTQHDWLEQPTGAYAVPSAVPPAGSPATLPRTDLVYIEAWEQGVSAVEDGELFDPALGGPDTTTRVRNMAKVKIAQGVGGNSCADAWTTLQQNWVTAKQGTIDADYELTTDVKLKLSFPGMGLPEDLCSPSVQGGYLGAENQAIRVQLRKNNTFTWGFDDAAPLYRVTVAPPIAPSTNSTVTMVTLPKDPYHWPLTDQVVEILPWSALLPNGEKVAAQEGPIFKVVASYSPNGSTFTINGSLPAGFGTIDWTGKSYKPPVLDKKETVYFYLRVWNRGTDTSSAAELGFTPATSPAAVTLGNTGLAVQFYGTQFQPNDYWVIAARPETPDKIWPWALRHGDGIAPMGVRRFFAPLALIQWTAAATTGTVTGTVISDCRKHFKPLTDQDCCCTFTVGDGVTSQGDYNSIQDAVDNMPNGGGKICILPGIHHDTVFIQDKHNIEICGCGGQAVIVPGVPVKGYSPASTKAADLAVFNIVSSGNIKLCSLTVLNFHGSAVAIYADQTGHTLCGIRVENCLLLAAGCVIVNNMGLNSTVGKGNVRIGNNRIGQYDIGGRMAAVFTLGDDVLIERNRIVVIPAPDKRSTNFPASPGDPTGGFYDPCSQTGGTTTATGTTTTTTTSAGGTDPYSSSATVWGAVRSGATYVCGVTADSAGSVTYKARGGIQIGSTSERVRVVENMILGGKGNGITFGAWLLDPAAVGAAVQTAEYAAYVNYDATFSADSAKANFNGSLYDILIADNSIQLMGLSGIGIAAVYSPANIGLIYRVDGLGIYRNKINRCAQQISGFFAPSTFVQIDGFVGGASAGTSAGTNLSGNAGASFGTSQLAAFGGIVLGACESPVIRENHITDNGVSAAYPVCGIYIQFGEGVEITDNRILNNGVVQAGDLVSPNPYAGNRGGIVIPFALQLLDTQNVAADSPPTVEGVPAANISGNEVDQPLGLALILVALGQVTVLGNRFTVRTLDTSNTAYAVANTVYIFNLGMAKDLLPLVVILFAIFAILGFITITEDQFTELVNSLPEIYAYLPGGQILFANNQVGCLVSVFDPKIPLLFGAQWIGSLDDVGYLDNQSWMTGTLTNGKSLAVVTLAHTILLGITVRSNDNRWQEGLTLAALSLFSFAAKNTCADNQATHVLLAIPTANTINNVHFF